VKEKEYYGIFVVEVKENIESHSMKVIASASSQLLFGYI